MGNASIRNAMQSGDSNDAIRAHVSKVTSALLARNGFQGVTVRDVAAEAGYSTHIVSHYFRDKQELLLFTWRESSERSAARVEVALNSGATIVECLEALLPLDEDRRVDVLVWFTFWARGVTDPEFADEQRRSGLRWRNLIQRILIDASDARSVSLTGDFDLLAQRIQAVVAGIGTHGVFDPLSWSQDRQRAILVLEIDMIFNSDKANTALQAPNLS